MLAYVLHARKSGGSPARINGDRLVKPQLGAWNSLVETCPRFHHKEIGAIILRGENLADLHSKGKEILSEVYGEDGYFSVLTEDNDEEITAAIQDIVCKLIGERLSHAYDSAKGNMTACSVL